MLSALNCVLAAEPDSDLEKRQGGQGLSALSYIGRERRHIMRSAEQQMIEKEINGCRITLSFSAKPVDGVMDKIQSILSKAYDERVQNDLMDMIGLELPCR